MYDTIGVFSSPRALYTFKAFGHDKVSVLDGGLPRWLHEGYDVEVGEEGDGRGETDYPLPKGPNPDFVRCMSHPTESVRPETYLSAYDQIVKNAELGPGSKEYEIVLDHRPRAR